MFPADREVQRILLELLNQMDGFDQNVNVKVGFASQLLVNISVNRWPSPAATVVFYLNEPRTLDEVHDGCVQLKPYTD